jgi:hypothetical protein
MADRYDTDRERGRDWDRERNAGREWDRNRDWGRDVGGDRSAFRREDWERNRPGGYYGNERYGEGRSEDYGQQRRGAGDEGWRDMRYSGSERVADYGNRGDWGNQGRWGAYGNRADYNRENDWREDRGIYRRPESDFGGQNTSRTNLFGTGGGGFGSGFSSYGAGMGGFSGSYGGGMGNYGERGRFTGRGPKGWRRSDDRIRDDINERLTDHPDVDASEIEVKVSNAEVTLTGTVDDRHAKRLAEDIAESISGVHDVHNQIRVQQRETANQGAGNQGEANRSTTSTSSRNK